MKSRSTVGGAALVRVLVAASVAATAIVLASPAVARGDTPVAETISVDTTWTAGTVKVLAGRVQVANGARLAIEPGAVIVGNGHGIEVFGKLEAVGTAGAPVRFRNVALRGVGVSTSTPPRDEVFTITLDHADVDGGSLQGGSGSMRGSWVLRNSIVSNTSDAMYLWYPLADCIIENNLFLNAKGIRCGVLLHDVRIAENVYFRTEAPTTSEDAVIENWAADGGAVVDATLNSFLSPGTWTLSVPTWASSTDLRARDNFWGTTDPGVIASMIFDRADDLSSPGYVDAGSPRSAPYPSGAMARLPLGTVLTVTPASVTTGHGSPIKLSATLRETGRDVGVAGAYLTIESSTDGTNWVPVGTMKTSGAGRAETTVAALERTFFRVSYPGAAGILSAPAAQTVTVLPQAGVGVPKVGTRVPLRNRLFTVTGSLTPRHPAGATSVRLAFYRYERVKGKYVWRLRSRVSARTADYSTYSRYRARVRLGYAGRWRVRAYHEDSSHALTYSGWRYFRVR